MGVVDNQSSKIKYIKNFIKNQIQDNTNFKAFSKNSRNLENFKISKFSVNSRWCASVSQGAQAQELWPSGMVIHPLKHTFFKLFKKTKKNDPKSQMDPKVCQFGTQNGHQNRPFLALFAKLLFFLILLPLWSRLLTFRSLGQWKSGQKVFGKPVWKYTSQKTQNKRLPTISGRFLGPKMGPKEWLDRVVGGVF